MFLHIALTVGLHTMGVFLKCKAAEILWNTCFHSTETEWSESVLRSICKTRNYDSTKINSLNVTPRLGVTFGVPCAWNVTLQRHTFRAEALKVNTEQMAQHQHHMFSRKSLPVKTTTSCTAGEGEHFHPEAQEFGIFAIPWYFRGHLICFFSDIAERDDRKWGERGTTCSKDIQPSSTL